MGMYIVMLEHQERLAIALLAITVLIIIAAFLVFGTIDRWQMAIPFTADSRDGDLVKIEGEVDRVTRTEEGGHLILSVDGVTVFIPAPVDDGLVLHQGDTIRVLGIAQTYKGEREVKVSNSEDIIILEQ